MKNVVLIYRGQVFDTEILPRLDEFKDDDVTLVTENNITRNIVKHLIRDSKQNITLLTADEFLDNNIITKFMKFDTILGNPPYSSDGDSDSIKLWTKFTEKSFLLLKDGGLITFITPQQILSHTKATVKAAKPVTRIQQFLENNQFLYYDETTDDYFSEGIPICSWSCIKSPKKDLTKIILNDGTIKELDYKVNLNVKEAKFDSILDKFTYNNSIPKYKRYRTLYTNVELSDIKTEEYKYNVHWNSKSNKFKYLSNQIDTRYKLCINNYKSFQVSDVNLFITNDDVSHSYFYITGSVNELKKIQKIWSLKLFQYIAENWKNSKGVYLIAQLQEVIPILDISKEWTDEKLYRFFNLSDDEIKEVERYVR